MAKRRRMTAKQRRYFAPRARRAVRRVARAVRSYRRGVRKASWLPLSGRDHMMAAGTGILLPKANELVAPYVDPYLEWAGDYKDEVRSALIGVVAHKFGPGPVREMGRIAYQTAIVSAGTQFGAGMFSGTSPSITGGDYLGA